MLQECLRLLQECRTGAEIGGVLGLVEVGVVEVRLGRPSHHSKKEAHPKLSVGDADRKATSEGTVH